jgi:hypothetical protein
MSPIAKAAHIWDREKDGHYVEPVWCSCRLFQVEKFSGEVWDPACGIGNIIESARAAHHAVRATDIVDRGYAGFDGDVDFLRFTDPVDNIVTNPPFHLLEGFTRHALKFARNKVAMIWLARRINAARWLRDTPLVRIWWLTPRPSMPPGHVVAAGQKPGGGTQDFCWLVWEQGAEYAGAADWLRRDALDQIAGELAP